MEVWLPNGASVHKQIHSSYGKVFEYRFESKQREFFLKLRTVTMLMREIWMENPLQSSSTTLKLKMETIMEANKPVLTQKNELENRIKSKLIALFRKMGTKVLEVRTIDQEFLLNTNSTNVRR